MKYNSVKFYEIIFYFQYIVNIHKIVIIKINDKVYIYEILYKNLIVSNCTIPFFSFHRGYQQYVANLLLFFINYYFSYIIIIYDKIDISRDKTPFFANLRLTY